jgi:hypothetical protein
MYIKIYRTIMLYVVLYGCETLLFTLRGERRLSVFENWVLRRIFEPNTNEIKGECRGLHEELNDLYTSPNIIRVNKRRRMRWVGHVASMGEMKGTYDHLEDPAVSARIIFGRIFKKWDGKHELN